MELKSRMENLIYLLEEERAKNTGNRELCQAISREIQELKVVLQNIRVSQ